MKVREPDRPKKQLFVCLSVQSQRGHLALDTVHRRDERVPRAEVRKTSGNVTRLQQVLQRGLQYP